jgi:heme oxygenase
MAEVPKARRAPVALPEAHTLLRRGTRRLHVRIDRTSVLASLIRSGVSPAEYATAMLALRRAYEEIDSVLLQSSGLCPSGLTSYTPRVPRIERDLRALDVRLDSLRPARRGMGLKLPATEAEYLGIRYVVEGAQLGGRFIYGQLCSTFGGGVHEFATFWSPESYPQGNWPTLLKSLTRVESRDGLASCVRTARLTFRHMDLCLRGEGSERV